MDKFLGLLRQILEENKRKDPSRAGTYDVILDALEGIEEINYMDIHAAYDAGCLSMKDEVVLLDEQLYRMADEGADEYVRKLKKRRSR